MPGSLSDSGGHTPTERTPADPTPVRSAIPGRRDEMGSDARITARIERREPTPPPLPPSPAAAAAAAWLARARPPSDRQPVAPASPSLDLTAPVSQQRGAPAWLFPLLLAVTALVVGMVLGALLFSHRTTCPAHGDQGSISPTSSSRADESTALYTAIDRRSA